MSELPWFERSPAVQAIQWQVEPFSLLEAARECCGATFGLNIWGWGQLGMVSTPGPVEQVFRDRTICAGEANRIMEPLVGSSSIFVVDGSVHRRTRSQMFAGMRQVGRFDDAVLLDTAARAFETQADGVPIAAQPLMAKITLSMIIRTLFGDHRPDVEERFAKDLRLLLGPVGALFAYLGPKAGGRLSPTAPVLRALQRIDRIIVDEIAAVADRGASNGLIHAWVIEAGDDLEASQIRDQVISFVGAATDTTASALAWSVYWLCTDPAAMDAVGREVAREWPDSALSPATSAPLMTSAIQEAMRLSPVAELMSRAVMVDDYEIDGVHIPKGVFLSACSYLSHRDPDVFTDPLSYRFDRFVDRTFSPYEYYPFGGGERRCIGSAWAIQEMGAVVATLLDRYRPRLVRGGRATRRNVTIAPSRGPVIELHRVQTR